jgi:xylulokinase
VAFAIRDNLAALESAGTQLHSITAIGGGSRSLYWLKVLATVLNLPVNLPADGDFGGAFGAARLALIAATGADPLTVCTAPAIKRTLTPETALSDIYTESYQRYRALYPALRDFT